MDRFYKYHHICKEVLVTHNLVKSGVKTRKQGKTYNKINNCIICKKYICGQTMFICIKWKVPLCCPVLTERILAPRDCFKAYHEKDFMISEFSTATLYDVDS